VELTSGWAKAVARPWNDDIPAASLRLERGGWRFLAGCAAEVAGWAGEVLSPATLPSSGKIWEDAGFQPAGTLLLLEHPLAGIAPAQHVINEKTDFELDRLNEIDRAAFLPRWRLGRLGLAESIDATSRSAVHVAEMSGEIAGFAITGVSFGAGYLQRLAVAAAYRRQGVGRSLVRTSLAWARARGALSMLVNTQIDNDAATDLYRSEGFESVPGGLVLWSYRRLPGTESQDR
jgi:ribosomal-protein-alanine N-acetyltransferase